MIRSVLNERQERFVHHYLAGRKGVAGNATNAAIAAGYAKTNAAATGSRMLRKANIAAAVAAHRKNSSATIQDELVEFSSMVPKAQRELVALLDHGDPSIRLSAIREVLDRALGRPKTPVHHTVRNIDAFLDELDLEETKSA